MQGSKRHYAEERKTVSKDYVLYHSICITLMRNKQQLSEVRSGETVRPYWIRKKNFMVAEQSGTHEASQCDSTSQKYVHTKTWGNSTCKSWWNLSTCCRLCNSITPRKYSGFLVPYNVRCCWRKPDKGWMRKLYYFFNSLWSLKLFQNKFWKNIYDDWSINLNSSTIWSL